MNCCTADNSHIAALLYTVNGQPDLQLSYAALSTNLFTVLFCLLSKSRPTDKIGAFKKKLRELMQQTCLPGIDQKRLNKVQPFCFCYLPVPQKQYGISSCYLNRSCTDYFIISQVKSKSVKKHPEMRQSLECPVP